MIKDAASPYSITSRRPNRTSTAPPGSRSSPRTPTPVLLAPYESITPVGPPTAPVADFSAVPTSGTSPLQVGFTDVSSGSPTSWAWDLATAGPPPSATPLHTYSTAGSYTVTLTVANAVGSDTKTRVEYISVLAPPPPVADFSPPARPRARRR